MPGEEWASSIDWSSGWTLATVGALCLVIGLSIGGLFGSSERGGTWIMDVIKAWVEKRKSASLIGFMLVLFGIMGALLLTLEIANDSDEIQLSIVIAIAIVAFMTMLFVIASGFSRISLTDSKQALGLPPGSIRAMIALILIQIFIIFGVFLFANLQEGTEFGPIRMTTAELSLHDDISRTVPILDANGAETGNFDVYRTKVASEDAVRMGQLLISTVGTLVVAVAGFYFGSSSVTNAIKATRSAAGTTAPRINGFSPREGKQGTTANLILWGDNFREVTRINLVQGTVQLPATNVVTSSDEELTCDVLLPATATGDWVVVAEAPLGSTQGPYPFRVTV